MDTYIDDDICFDRNDNSRHDDISEMSIEIAKLRSTIDNADDIEFKIKSMLLDIVCIQKNTIESVMELSISNTDIICQDMFKVGHINDSHLDFVIDSIILSIDLRKIIVTSITDKKCNIVKLILANCINITAIEPNIVSLCMDHNLDNLVVDLIKAEIDISIGDYKSIYVLTMYGKLELIKLVLESYILDNSSEIIGRICALAAQYNHRHILEHFFTPNAFAGAPDIMYNHFINSIKYGHLSIIKFFVESGIDIRRFDCRALHLAQTLQQTAIIDYFDELLKN